MSVFCPGACGNAFGPVGEEGGGNWLPLIAPDGAGVNGGGADGAGDMRVEPQPARASDKSETTKIPDFALNIRFSVPDLIMSSYMNYAED